MIKKEKVYTVAKNIAYTDLDNEKVLLNLEDGKYLTLNQSGSIIFEHFDGKKSISEIIDGISKSYNLDISDIERDVLVFSESLFKKKIIF